MSTLLELENPFEVITPVGEGYAILVESDTSDQWWTVILSNGAIVTVPQKKIRVKRGYSLSRGISDEEMRKIVEP